MLIIDDPRKKNRIEDLKKIIDELNAIAESTENWYG